MGTFQAKKGEVDRQWVLIDARDMVLGKLAVKAASILRGKTKPEFTPHADVGDFVVVINAKKVSLTGKKWKEKIYTHHSGYPGGLKQASAEKIAEKKPERLITMA
ncbi:MAG TPA: 50S ribosomal protein L13, partial [Desulfomonilia bacterium]|nr:50S ribosomal protein L13 [Desulfomonilia bacterium]